MRYSIVSLTPNCLGPNKTDDVIPIITRDQVIIRKTTNISGYNSIIPSVVFEAEDVLVVWVTGWYGIIKRDQFFYFLSTPKGIKRVQWRRLDRELQLQIIPKIIEVTKNVALCNSSLPKEINDAYRRTGEYKSRVWADGSNQ